jgi:hypothetical protein
MGRTEKLVNVTAAFFADRFEENMKNIANHFRENYEEILKGFSQSIKHIYEIALSQQRSGKKDSISFLHIAHLRSSLLTGSYHYKISLYNEKFYLDEIETSVYWPSNFLFQYVKQDMNEAKELIHRSSKNLKASEFDLKELQYYYSQLYHPTSLIFIERLFTHTKEIMEEERWSTPLFSSGFSVVFGGYMEKGFTLYPKTLS